MTAAEGFERFAIFWLPPVDSALAQFGCDWFGVCPERGETGQPADFGLPVELATEAIARPRRYTLHGTIVAPFRPAENISGEDLAGELRAFCARRAARRTGPLRLTRLTRHLALVPEGGITGLDWLAADCVTHFNAFRAPTTEADLARFPPAQHSPRQRQHVREFGYPYVLSDFVFHITLAGPLAPDRLGRVEAALAPTLTPLIQTPLEIDSLCLLGDPGGNAPFRLIARGPLIGRSRHPRAGTPD
jgi:hypothetical protein